MSAAPGAPSAHTSTRCERSPSYRELSANLAAKLEHPDFLTDLNALIIHQPGGYDILTAADLLMERLGAHLKNAPSDFEIAHGAWRE